MHFLQKLAFPSTLTYELTNCLTIPWYFSFKDEHGNWQTYTFGGETQTSTILTSEYDPADSRAAKSGESRSSSRVFPRSIFTGYPGTGEPGSRRPSRPLGGEEGTEASGGGYSANPNYTANSRSSSESGKCQNAFFTVNMIFNSIS